MYLQQNISLLPYNTFGINVLAAYFAEITEINQLKEISSYPYPKFIIGGGSNILLTKNIDGLVLLNCLKGINIIDENKEHVWLEVFSGELWHNLVLYAIERNLGGIENLALIPGTVGAAPIQNIGAYGAEAKETIESVNWYDWQSKEFITLKANECLFGYRNSIFKHKLKDKGYIVSVVFKLNKFPKFNTSYGAIETELDRMGITDLSVNAITNAVISIRQSKLPDTKLVGNAGSFFKNPEISIGKFNYLKTINPLMPSFAVNDNLIKVPAGWLIEQCGWKGFRNGDAGVHTNQALVLINTGAATGEEILNLSTHIIYSVKQRFDIELEREVQVW